jgi:hypothetical protein
MNGVSRRILVIVGTLTYLFVLHWVYVEMISPRFSYMGYTYHPPDLKYLVSAWLIGMIPSLWMPIAHKRPSQLVYWMLYVLVLVPASMIPLYTLHADPGKLLLFAFLLMASFALLGVIYVLPLFPIPRIKIPPLLFWFVIILLSLVFYLQIVSVFGFRFHFVPLLDVYRVRYEYRDVLSESGVFVAYAIGWQSQVINPLLIITGLVRKKLSLLIIGVLGQIMIYSITGFKSVFFSGVFLFILWFVMKQNRNRFGLCMIWGMVGLVCLSYLVDSLTQSLTATSLFVRRTIITPGLLTGYFYDFFSENPKALLAHSILKDVFHYPYHLDPSNLIGYLYEGDAETSANANIWADAYANFGMWGVLAFTLLLAFVLWTYDSLAKSREHLIGSLLLAVHSMTLSNSALLTSLFNHGLGLTWLIVYLMPKTSLSLEKNPIGSGETENGRNRKE